MKQRTRTSNSVINFITGFLSNIIVIIFGFVVRSIFIKCLNEDYMGANGLYSNILSMLSLMELGFGTAIVYSMYRPFAKKDYGKIAQLLKLYKKVYIIVGTVVLVVGLSAVPFLGTIVKKGSSIDGLELYYILYLLSTVVSYWFFAYHQSILQADQKAYIISAYFSLFNIIKSIFQILVLIFFRSYLLYLIVQIVCKIAQSWFLKIKAKKEYPQIYNKEAYDIAKKEKDKIFSDVKALMLNKFAFVMLNCTDNIIISAVIGLSQVGMLSNYMLITDVVSIALCQVAAAVQASLGNFFAKKEAEQGYVLFKRIDFLTFWLYGFSTTALIVLLNPFITLWLGEKYTFNFAKIVVIAVNFLIAGFMNTTWTFRTTLGLFTQGKYRPFIAALMNIILSILMGMKWGVTGVLLATTISRLLLNAWYDPYVIHRYGFNKPIRPYYIYTFKRILLLTFTVCFTYFATRIIIPAGRVTVIGFLCAMLLTALIPNIIFLLVFHRSSDFKHLAGVAKFILIKSLKKLNIIK